MNKLLCIPRILYHGTSSENKQYLSLKDIEKIDINYGDKFSDFSQGFYLTSIFEQALQCFQCGLVTDIDLSGFKNLKGL